MKLNEQILGTFDNWFKDAQSTAPSFFNAMNLATATPEGFPSSRVVLLKDFDEDGFVFYTNYQSRKGVDLGENPHAAATFWWPELQRQVRIEGTIEKVSREDSERYFYSRPPLSQVASAVSEQSQPIDSFEELETRFEEAQSMQEPSIKCPDHWGGYRLVPRTIEFWQGKEHRLHERKFFKRGGDDWQLTVLQP